MEGLLIRILKGFVQSIAVLVLWIGVGYGVAIGLRYAIHDMPDFDTALSALPGGEAVLDATGWVEQQISDVTNGLSVVGYLYLPNGVRIPCVVGTPRCTPADLNPPPLQTSHLNPLISNQTVIWLAVGALAVAAAALTRRWRGRHPG